MSGAAPLPGAAPRVVSTPARAETPLDEAGADGAGAGGFAAALAQTEANAPNAAPASSPLSAVTLGGEFVGGADASDPNGLAAGPVVAPTTGVTPGVLNGAGGGPTAGVGADGGASLGGASVGGAQAISPEANVVGPISAASGATGSGGVPGGGATSSLRETFFQRPDAASSGGAHGPEGGRTTQAALAHGGQNPAANAALAGADAQNSTGKGRADASEAPALSSAASLPAPMATTAATASAAPPPGAGAATPAAQTALQLQHAARTDGRSVTFVLNPPEMGRVEIRLRAGQGDVRAVVRVEKAEALEALRPELRALERALSEASGRAGQVDLNFQDPSQRRHGFAFQDGRHDGAAHPQDQAPSDDDVQGARDDAGQTPDSAATTSRTSSAGGLDIRL